MRKRLILAGLAAAALLGLVLWRAPAGWSLEVLKWSNPELAWSDAEGSVWRGAADSVRWHGLHLGRVTWRFTGMESWQGLRARWLVSGESPQYRLSAELFPAPNRTLRVDDAHGSLPAAWIDLGAVAPLTYLTGRLQIHLARLSLSRGRLVFARGDIRWMEAGVAGLANVRLGAIHAKLRPAPGDRPGATRLELTGRGPADVLVQGKGLIVDHRYELSLDLRVAADRPRLRNRLLSFGRPGENGTIAIQLQGSLPP